jgi:hypothetical protein
MNASRQGIIQLLILSVILAGVVIGTLALLRSPQTTWTAEPMDSTSVPCLPVSAALLHQIGALLKTTRTPCDSFYWMPNPTDEFHILVRFNNFGLHAPIYSFEKPAGVFRVLIIGDSFPQAMQVRYEDAFPQRLEDLLSQQLGRPIEVTNLSIDAYGTDRELLLYALLGWQFQPDLVLLSVYTGNDMQDNQIDLETRRYGYRIDRPFFTLEGDTLRLHNSTIFDRNLYPNVPVFGWLVNHQNAQSPSPPQNPPAQPVVLNQQPYQLEYPVELGLYLPEDEHWENAWALTTALIREFNQVVRLSNVPFAMFIIPDRRAVHSEDWQATLAAYAPQLPVLNQIDPIPIASRLIESLPNADFPILDLTTNLQKWVSVHPDQRLYYGGDGHFNAVGHAVTAELLANWLISLQMVPADR